MSHFHFCSTKAYKKRIIQLGENPKNVFCVGALGIDNILSNKYLKIKQLEKEFSLPFSKKYFYYLSSGNFREKLLTAIF